MARQNDLDQTAVRRAAAPPVDDPTRLTLRAFRPVVERHLDDIVEEFCAYVTAWPEVRALLDSDEPVAFLKKALGQHLLDLFAADFDESYFAQVDRINQAHERVGLEPRWYLGAYAHVLKRLIELAIETYPTEPERLVATVRAVNQVIEFDMDGAIAACEAASQRQSRPQTRTGRAEHPRLGGRPPPGDMGTVAQAVLTAGNRGRYRAEKPRARSRARN